MKQHQDAREEEGWARELEQQGYCIIPDALPAEAIAALDGDLADDFERTPFCEGLFYGAQTKRFGRLLARSPRMAALVGHRLILGLVENVLQPWCDRIQRRISRSHPLRKSVRRGLRGKGPNGTPRRKRRHGSHRQRGQDELATGRAPCRHAGPRRLQGCATKTMLGFLSRPATMGRGMLPTLRHWPNPGVGARVT